MLSLETLPGVKSVSHSVTHFDTLNSPAAVDVRTSGKTLVCGRQSRLMSKYSKTEYVSL